jgi:hypothetical protein
MQQTDLEKGMHTVLGVGIAVPTTSAGTDAGNRHGNRYSTWRGVLFQRRVIQRNAQPKNSARTSSVTSQIRLEGEFASRVDS